MPFRRFYWVVPEVLAGCSRPGLAQKRYSGEDANERAAAEMAADLEWLSERGISALLTLTERALPAHALAKSGLVTLHLPIPDMEAPLPEDFDRALGFIDTQQREQRPVAVHCLAGQGRTGTVLAAYLIRDGRTAEQAIQYVRDLCPGAIQSERQEIALATFARTRAWIT